MEFQSPSAMSLKRRRSSEWSEKETKKRRAKLKGGNSLLKCSQLEILIKCMKRKSVISLVMSSKF
jgi:hypothetical protein